jgi:hypothetical protein
MEKLSYGVAVLERETLQVNGDFICHVCVSDGSVLTSMAQLVSMEDSFLASVMLDKVEYTITGSVSSEGLLVGKFKSVTGLEGSVEAYSHVGGFVGSYKYVNEHTELVERKLRLVPVSKEG